VRGSAECASCCCTFHGEEPIEFACWIGAPVIKAFGLGGGKDEREGWEGRRPRYHFILFLFWLVLSSAKAKAP
jgi:hypothetical protein